MSLSSSSTMALFTNGGTISKTFAYDHEGRVTAFTNTLGKVVSTDYDARGNVVSEDGATYPVRYGYDHEGRRISLMTTRDNGEAWDETTWSYDDPTGLCLSKTYADGSTTTYTYAPDGKPARLTYPGGKWNERVHDARGLVTNVVHSAGTTDTSFTHDAYGKVVRAVDTAGNEWRYAYADDGVLTNEVQMIGGHTNVIERFVDEWRRPSGYALFVDGSPKGLIRYAYDEEGRIVEIAATNSAGRGFTVAYTNGAGYNYGYSLTTANGDVLRRIVERDPYRRELTRSCTTTFNDTTVAEFGYSFDAGGRPVSRNDDTFAYNDRDEVIASTIGTNVFGHVYDTIGNHIQWSGNSVTNIYANNNLNQTVEQVSLLAGASGISETANAFTWAAAGGLQTDGRWVYEFDAEDRLASVTSAAMTNGAIRVVNTYDYRHRRIGKDVYSYFVDDSGNETDSPLANHWQLTKHHDFVYDDWNLIHEIVTVCAGYPNTVEIQYFWGSDLSGTLQGSVGVGGLLAMLSQNECAFPVFDNNGNVVIYIDEDGRPKASYVYDDFGNLLEIVSSCNDFRFRFSTKYCDEESQLSYFPFRCYSNIMRSWASRDYDEIIGGVNLYSYCRNSSTSSHDPLGLWTATVESSGQSRRVYVMGDSDTEESLAVEVGLDPTEISKWAKIEVGKIADSKTAKTYTAKSVKAGCYVSVPNIWIAADMLRGGRVLWDQCIVNHGGTIGMLVGTSMFTSLHHKILKPRSPRELLLNVLDNKGDLWGIVVFAHGPPGGSFLVAPLKKDDPTYGKIISQDKLIDSIQQGGYKIARAYMMQCYSAANNFEVKWRRSTMKFYGYSGVNLLGLDLGSGLWPWNWFSE